MMDDLQFEKLDMIDAVIRQRCTEITHITVHEVLDRNGYPQLGRVCFGAVDLGPFIESEAEDPTDDDDEPDEDADGELAEGEPLGDLARTYDGVTYAVLADAAVRWIKHMADQNMVGQREAKFKVNLWKGKGDKVIYSSRFLCTNTDYEDVPVVPAPTVALPALVPDTSPDPRTWRALGEGYQNFIALVQSTYSHLANLQNAHITSQSGQLARAQRTNENIVGQLTNLKIGAWYLDTLHTRYKGNTALALAGYNAGEGNSDRWVAASPNAPTDFTVETISFRETRHYVKRVMSTWLTYRVLYGDGPLFADATPFVHDAVP